MLSLVRKQGECIYIVDERHTNENPLIIQFIKSRGQQVKLAFDAIQEYKIYREEIYWKMVENGQIIRGQILSEENNDK